MPLIALLIGAFEVAVASLVGRVLLALGLSYVTYTGFDVAVTWLLNQLKANMGAMPVDVLNFLTWLWVDKAMALLFSTYAAAVVIKMSVSGALTKLVRK